LQLELTALEGAP
jgi:hypothetical protein